ncbi:MAG: DUF1343 domain-containing protein, partial [Acidobacteriota bacterium]|nr:DUF1343 domain-containing protein [Acidobacteriota bacterium]
MKSLQARAVKLGLEKGLDNEIQLFKNKRIGLICNQASVDHKFRHSADLFFENSNINLVSLFGP